MAGRGTWRVGRLAGIPIGIHPLFAPELAVSELLEPPAFARVRRAVAIAPGGEPVGIVSISDIARAGTIHDLLDAPPRTPALQG